VLVFLSGRGADLSVLELPRLLKLLRKRKTSRAAIRYLLNLDEIKPVTRELIDRVINVATCNKDANLLLCRFAKSKKGSRLLMDNLEFLEWKLPDYEFTFRVAMALCSENEDYIRDLCDSESFIILLTEISKSERLSYLGYLLTFVNASSCVFSPTAIELLNAYGFFKLLFTHEVVRGDDELLASAFAFLGSCLLATYLDVPDKIFDLIRHGLEDKPLAQKRALEFCTAISRFHNYRDHLLSLKVEILFQDLRTDKGPKEQIQLIGKNLKQLQHEQEVASRKHSRR
jgi:hypothetical protein